jgi:hypothetical protein
MDKVRELAKSVSNWDRWGADDERGTLNFITPDVVKRAAGLVKRGQVFSLGLTFGAEGPQIGQGGRVNPLHLMTGGRSEAARRLSRRLSLRRRRDGLSAAVRHAVGQPRARPLRRPALQRLSGGDDVVRRRREVRHRQGRRRRRLARRAARHRPPEGRTASRARHRDHARPISKPPRKPRAVRVERGDVLLVRTGHLSVFTADGDRIGYMRMMPGLGMACAAWLHAREVAAVASDTNSVEVIPFEDPKTPLPLHLLALRDMGLTLGEMFVLDALADDCAADGVVGVPLHRPAPARQRRHRLAAESRSRIK